MQAEAKVADLSFLQQARSQCGARVKEALPRSLNSYFKVLF